MPSLHHVSKREDSVSKNVSLLLRGLLIHEFSTSSIKVYVQFWGTRGTRQAGSIVHIQN